jgi:hypothetical protein
LLHEITRQVAGWRTPVFHRRDAGAEVALPGHFFPSISNPFVNVVSIFLIA